MNGKALRQFGALKSDVAVDAGGALEDARQRQAEKDGRLSSRDAARQPAGAPYVRMLLCKLERKKCECVVAGRRATARATHVQVRIGAARVAVVQRGDGL